MMAITTNIANANFFIVILPKLEQIVRGFPGLQKRSEDRYP